jgi:hypothetical protein
MARYYNITSKKGLTTNKQYLQISECNSLGQVITTGGVHSSNHVTSISYSPIIPDDGFFTLTNDSGKRIGIPFTFQNVVKYNGALHGHSNTLDLFLEIRTDLES